MSDETFRDFRDSFFYGSRCDLNFKFLKSLPEEEAARLFEELLHTLGDSIDDGDTNRLAALVAAWQTHAYNAHPPRTEYDDGPFTPLSTTLSQARLALLTSSGHYVAGHDPQPLGHTNMTQEEAIKLMPTFMRRPAALAAIPLDTPPDQLRVRHGGYDIRSTEADPGVTFPLNHLRALAREGLIGSLVDPAYSFIGVTAQRRLLNHEGPQWVQQLQAHGAQGAVLVPV